MKKSGNKLIKEITTLLVAKIFFNGEVCNHIWSDEFAVDIEPTCEETGQKSIHCTVCGLMKKRF